MSPPLRTFASDNNAGIHPRVLAAIRAANVGHARAYGDDALTEAATACFRQHLGDDVAVFFVFGGTAANVLGLTAVTERFHAVICSEVAHINVDECGAPERFTGCKLLPVPAPAGKLTVEALVARIIRVGDQHHVQPKVVSITQSTEYGTVYTPEEIRALSECAHAHGLLVHMDGARLANAAATLGLPLRSITRDIGIDVLSFGGTKNGLMGAEAIIFFDASYARDFKFIRKQGMQLASKMRFLAAQFVALFADDLWLRNARHANAMAQRLAEGVRPIAGVRITQPVEANAVFAIVPPSSIAPLQEARFFYVWDERRSEVRWMTSFDTTEADVDDFVSRVGAAAALSARSGGP